MLRAKDFDGLDVRFESEATVEGGLLKGKRIERSQFEEALTTYYRMRGYDDEGIPIREKLQELNIEWAWTRMTQVEDNV